MKILFGNSPRSVMFRVIDAAWPYSASIPQKPGEFVMRLSPETREALSRLRSRDIADVRWPDWDEPKRRR